jgi:hypothetical protein
MEESGTTFCARSCCVTLCIDPGAMLVSPQAHLLHVPVCMAECPDLVVILNQRRTLGTQPAAAAAAANQLPTNRVAEEAQSSNVVAGRTAAGATARLLCCSSCGTHCSCKMLRSQQLSCCRALISRTAASAVYCLISCGCMWWLCKAAGGPAAVALLQPEPLLPLPMAGPAHTMTGKRCNEQPA